jgi:hypothetical protein
MAGVDYGVVEQGGVWVIIGDGLRFGSYRGRAAAERAARRLAESSSVDVRLHVQDDAGRLLPPEHLN